MLKCQACDYQDTVDKFPIKPIRTMMGHAKLFHCPKCDSAMVKKVSLYCREAGWREPS